MKKLVFLACFMAICSFMACGNKTETNVSADSTATDTVDTVNVADTIVSDSVITAE